TQQSQETEEKEELQEETDDNTSNVTAAAERGNGQRQSREQEAETPRGEEQQANHPD
ncbi:hypothetical protein PF002_g28261, partial [Phytophthora fragariae]